ncbi:MAG: helix-turn-helix domain-containing protein [Maribacter sp.]
MEPSVSENNKGEIACGVTFCMAKIGGKWKPIILFRISKGINRFTMLLKEIEGINRQMLSKQLKELEKSGILERKLFPEIPPRVEYSLTPFGKSLMPVIQSMNRWGQKHKTKKKVTQASNTNQLPLFD